MRKPTHPPHLTHHSHTNMTRILFRIAMWAGLTLLPLTSLAAQDYQLQLLEQAHQTFQTATNQTQFAQAAEHYEALISEEQIHNGKLYYTTGNAWFLAGNLGRAILNYRRAERFIPSNKDLQYNLQTALTQQKDLIEPQPRPILLQKLFGWHFALSPRLHWLLFASAYIAAWAAGFTYRRNPTHETRLLFGGTAIVALLFTSSLIANAAQQLQSRPAVILADEVLARKGNGEMYAPAFLDPLHAGTECRQLEQRGDWKKIKLANGETCWLPAQSVETL